MIIQWHSLFIIFSALGYLVPTCAAPPSSERQKSMMNKAQVYWNQISKEQDPSKALLSLIPKDESILETILKEKNVQFYPILRDILVELLSGDRISRKNQLRLTLFPDLINWKSLSGKSDSILGLLDLEDFLFRIFMVLFVPQKESKSEWAHYIKLEVQTGPDIPDPVITLQIARLVFNNRASLVKGLNGKSQLRLIVNHLLAGSLMSDQSLMIPMQILQDTQLRPLLEVETIKSVAYVAAQAGNVELVREVFKDPSTLHIFTLNDYIQTLKLAGPHDDISVIRFLYFLSNHFLPEEAEPSKETIRVNHFKNILSSSSRNAFEVFFWHPSIPLSTQVLSAGTVLAARLGYSDLAVHALEYLEGEVVLKQDAIGQLFCLGYGLDVFSKEDIEWVKDNHGTLDTPKPNPNPAISQAILNRKDLRALLSSQYLDRAVIFIFMSKKNQALEELFKYPDLIEKISNSPFKAALTIGTKDRDVALLNMALDRRWKLQATRSTLDASGFLEPLFLTMIKLKGPIFRTQLRSLMEAVPEFGSNLNDQFLKKVLVDALKAADMEVVALAGGPLIGLETRNKWFQKWIQLVMSHALMDSKPMKDSDFSAIDTELKKQISEEIESAKKEPPVQVETESSDPVIRYKNFLKQDRYDEATTLFEELVKLKKGGLPWDDNHNAKNGFDEEPFENLAENGGEEHESWYKEHYSAFSKRPNFGATKSRHGLTIVNHIH